MARACRRCERCKARANKPKRELTVEGRCARDCQTPRVLIAPNWHHTIHLEYCIALLALEEVSGHSKLRKCDNLQLTPFLIYLEGRYLIS